jgi:hypothetical protein
MIDKRKIIVYVSGAYYGKDSGQSIKSNVELAKQAAIELWERGYGVICPHTNSHFTKEECNCNYDDYLVSYLEIVKRCNVVFMLDNWKESNGASTERQIALENDIPVFYKIQELEDWFENKYNNS